MPPLRVLMCDDEPLALDRLATLLKQCPGVDLVGSVLSGRDLLAEVERLAPDLILLDIEMPQLDGFDVVEALARMSWPAAAPPLVIFVTAHPEFAVNAFDSGALDFISKPVRLSRLERALQRAAAAAAQREARRRLQDLSGQLDLLKRMRAEAGEDHIWVRRGPDTLRLEIGEVDWIGAEGEYVRFHVGDDSFLERGSLTDALARFEPFGFIRIHRSAIVNPDRIASIEKTPWAGLALRLRNGAQLRVSKKFRAAVRELTRSGLTSARGSGAIEQ
jgi:DNA-binding LytR/AlgR family response regulator